MEKKKIELEVGKRVLYHVDGMWDILEGMISEISPNGKLFKIGERWYSGDSRLDQKGPIVAEILDELPSRGSKVLSPAPRVF